MTRSIVIKSCLLLVLSAARLFAQQPVDKHPNIVIILADDLGFSDLGCYGSEIQTPHLDRLAREGLQLSQFYNSGRCCPSRAALLTGLYPHQAGIGDMIQNKGPKAYQGYLNEHSVTIAQLLKTAGYQTIVSGKWHVGLVPSAWAVNRGFDKSFTLQNNGSSYFNSQPLYNDGRTVTFLVGDKEIQRQDTSRYLTQAITDFACRSLDSLNRKDPFFLYVAYTAPHWPIQALPEDIARYKDRYRDGWDSLRVRRYRKQIAAGLIRKEWPLSDRFADVPDWSSLSPAEQEKWALRMAIYAAMIDRMDRSIGAILTRLKTTQQDRQTVVLFMSDNGGSADEVQQWDYVTQKRGTPGSVASIDSYDPPWGNVSNTPFRLFKKNTHEGGIASPFIAYCPGLIKAGTVGASVTHLIDVLPTCLSLAGITYPAVFQNKPLTPLEGKSLLPLFDNKPFSGHETLFWEHEGSRAVRKGNWKLVAEIDKPWELYDLNADRTETRNLASNYPQLVAELANEHTVWSTKVGVVDWHQLK
ncbi:arylsulfatase [Spirosoma oryzae]|uniref:Arylsulfatase n=1 Tax=Spirosoma oryzae TaxID=1469603 RepID=A0A2T0S339_9BACT|nr:arylsulfatase [Spirosoma oryzae]PRY27835.1 arylsulfatase [Spirosoma oryzae]